MSEDKSSKTEEPTHKRLRDARKKAQVSRSEELVPLMMILTAILYFFFSFDWLLEYLQAYFSSVGNYAYDRSFEEAVSAGFTLWFDGIVLSVMLPFSLMMLAAGIVGNVIQFGFIFSVDPIIPKPEKIDPIKGFARVFSMKQVVKTLLSIFKIATMTVIIIVVVKVAINEYMHEIAQCDLQCQLGVLKSMLKKMLLILIPILVLMVMLDIAFQKFQFHKDQRMTKDEVKREYKSMEGDPMMKGQRRAEQRKMLQEDVKEQVMMSRVIIAGMRKAVALMYEPGMDLPILLAIGRDRMSNEMIKIAKAQGVPVIADPALVQIFEDDGVIDQFIPASAVRKTAQAMKRR
ncbi:MAG: Type III secretion system protein [uncultured Thiotrichaceae bacterium]|uniref:Type III secretion system protein n=1 Tax=uncultured Thiotrichaceae bacterium TaxID=298394 RepID=A0A6S6T4Q0_9GAMM|nr:MAG: Type III secretion system protein [uncultured Thiotrichaceae bacterium]